MLFAVIYKVCWSPDILYIYSIFRNVTNQSFRIKTKVSVRLLLREEAHEAPNLVSPGICNLYRSSYLGSLCVLFIFCF